MKHVKYSKFRKMYHVIYLFIYLFIYKIRRVGQGLPQRIYSTNGAPIIQNSFVSAILTCMMLISKSVLIGPYFET